MKKILSIVAALSAFAAVFALASCSKETPFIGRWAATAPVDITAQIDGASNASSQLTVDFADNLQKDGGAVTISSVVSISRMAEPVAFQLKALATVDGEWTYDVDDQDDLLLNLRLSDLKVDISPDDVTLAAMPDATPQQTDSIKLAVIDRCRHEIMRALSSDLARFSVVSDVEVKNGRQMEFEIESPETTLRFVKEGV